MPKSLIFAVLAVLPRLAAAAEGRPNFLFLLADDQRADTIGAHGNRHIRTPSIDSLVAGGFSFRRNYCLGSNSGAVCVPSRAMVMSGKHWMRIRNDLAGEKILPELLAESGYETFITGKWHNEQGSLLRGFERGKAVFLGGMSDHERVPVQDIAGKGKLGNRRFGEKFSSELFADAAIEFLEGHDGEKPFFLYVPFTAPHDPRQPPLEYRRPYYRERPPLPPNFLPLHPFDNGHAGGRDENLAPWPRTEEVVRDQLAEYYGMISHLDAQVGRILAALARSRWAGDTVIIYAADSGLAVGSHGLLGKQSVYEHSMRSPLIFSGPGIPKGGESRALSALVDVFPTVCGLAGIEAPAGLDGRDLRPVWEGRAERVRESVFLPFEDVQRAVVTDRWKLIVYPRVDHRQLFDLEADPHETADLAGDAAQADRIRGLLEEMGAHRQRLGDTLPLRAASPKPLAVDPTGRDRPPDRWQPAWIRDKYFRGRRAGEAELAQDRREAAEFGPRPPAAPNFVIIFCDDLGWGDLGCYGSPTIRTPHLDRLASEGQRWTSFYSAASVCTPSRAGLLTGRYPVRSGMCAESPRVLTSGVSKGGIPASEVLLPEALRARGYATACIGKWHLGHRPEFLPTEHGFDSFFGLDASNDHNARQGIPEGEAEELRRTSAFWDNALYRDGEPIELPADQRRLTERYTEEALRFIESRKDRPFLLYLPHTFPHTPLFASRDFAGRSPRGLYGDVVEEIDWSVGRIRAKLEELGLAGKTLVVFTSDNGPWRIRGLDGGSAGPLRDGKGSTWEGGMRVPCIFWWPGMVHPGVVDGIGSTLDLIATCLSLAGAPLPEDRIIDGRDLSESLLRGAPSPRDHMIYYRGVEIHAVRQGPWKAHFLTRPAYGPGSDRPERHDPPLLYHLGRDPGESVDVARQHPEAIEAIRRLVADHEAKLIRGECQLVK